MAQPKKKKGEKKKFLQLKKKKNRFKKEMSSKHRKIKPKGHKSQLEGALTGITRDNLNIKVSNNDSRVTKESHIQPDKHTATEERLMMHQLLTEPQSTSPHLSDDHRGRGLHAGEGWQTPC